MGRTMMDQTAEDYRKARPETALVDSGEREVTASGFMREPDADKPDLSWIFTVEGLEIVPKELIVRIARHYHEGGKKYAPDNWKKGTDQASLARNLRSLTRHLFQWFRGEQDEDHLAAVVWNLITYEINSSKALQDDDWLDDA